MFRRTLLAAGLAIGSRSASQCAATHAAEYFYATGALLHGAAISRCRAGMVASDGD
jgi:hypothetical protein